MKTFELDFLESALREWKKLGATVQRQFTKKLKERLAHPHVPAARLSGLPNCYKIKLKKSGYRLVYQVEDDALVIVVIAVGPRERGEVYKSAAGRTSQ